MAFDRNHYCIDVTFYYRVLADATIGAARPAALYGLAVFTKRAVLCGEDSRAHIYRSDTRLSEADGATRRYANLPTAVVEVTDTNSQSNKPTHIRNADQLIFLPQKEKILICLRICLISTACSAIMQLRKSPVAAKILSGGYYGNQT